MQPYIFHTALSLDEELLQNYCLYLTDSLSYFVW